MEWTTSIGDSRKGTTVVRGYALEELIDGITFTQAVFLVLTGRLPSRPGDGSGDDVCKDEDRLFDAILVSSIEHGLGAPSTTVARTVASTGNPMNAGLAAGLLAQGTYHGGAIEGCMRILLQGTDAKSIVDTAVQKNHVLSGFGHKLYAVDPRTTRLFAIAEECGCAGQYVCLAADISRELSAAKERPICVNVDGAIAALLCELGFEPDVANGVFAISRIAGLVAHVAEERKGRPYHRLSEEEYRYVGECGRSLKRAG